MASAHTEARVASPEGPQFTVTRTMAICHLRSKLETKVTASSSNALHDLVDTRVDSFEKLELVMALRRSKTQRCSIADLAHALDLPRDELRSAVLELQDAGLLRFAHDEVTLAPRAPDDQRALDELAEAYDRDKVTLVKAITERSLHRLRGLAGRAFAGAFVFGRRP